MLLLGAVKFPSPPLLDQTRFVTLVSVASKIEILAPSQIFCDTPGNNSGFS